MTRHSGGAVPREDSVVGTQDSGSDPCVGLGAASAFHFSVSWHLGQIKAKGVDATCEGEEGPSAKQLRVPPGVPVCAGLRAEG